MAAVATRDDEKALVRRILDGDEAAFAELVEQHYSALIRLARMYVRSQTVAEEVVQETWLAVLKGLEKFEGRSSLKTWIFRILINRAKSRGVKEARTLPFSAVGPEDGDEGAVDAERFRPDGTWMTPPEAWGDDLPEKLLLQKEMRQMMETEIEALPPNQRAVVTLRDLEGWSSADVCNVLELTETNQRVLLHRGRSKVRQALEKHLKK